MASASDACIASGDGGGPLAFSSKLQKFQPALEDFSDEVPQPVIEQKTCSECLEAAEVYCPRCCGEYCLKCFNIAHARVQLLKNHVWIPLTDAKLHTQMCPSHPDQTGQICENDGLIACQECLSKGLHKGHVIRTEEEQEAVCGEIQMCLQKAEKTLKILKDSDKDIRCALSRVELDAVEAWNMFKSRMTALHGALQMYEDKIEQQLLNHAKKCITNANVQHKLLMNNLKTTKKTIQEMQELEKNPKCSSEIRIGMQTQMDTFNGMECVAHQSSASIIPSVPDTLLNMVRLLSKCEGFNVESNCTVTLKRRGETTENLSTQHSNRIEATIPPAAESLPVIGSKEKVMVSFAPSPKLFYVQLLKDNDRLVRMGKDIDEHCKHLGEPASVEVGNMYICQYERIWYRAVVKRLIDSGDLGVRVAHVFYIDYGNEDIVAIDSIFPIPDALKHLPEMAVPCCLSGVTPIKEEWSDDVKELFLRMVTNFPALVIVNQRIGRILEVDLIRHPNDLVSNDVPTSMADFLVWTNHARYATNKAKFGFRHSSTSSREYVYPTDPVVGCEYPVVVSYTANPDCFFIQYYAEDNNALADLMERIQELYTNKEKSDELKLTIPYKKMLCVARFTEDGKWYRATVEDIPANSKVKVRYVDYGNTEILPWFEIRKMKDEFMQLSAQAVQCKLVDIDHIQSDGWTREGCAAFQDMAENKELVMRVEALGLKLSVLLMEQKGNATMCINARLVKEGFASAIGKRLSRFIHQKKEMLALKSKASSIVRSESPVTSTDFETPSSTIDFASVEFSHPDVKKLIPVTIKGIDTPNRFFVVLEQADVALYRISNALMNKYKRRPALSDNREWKQGDMCAAKVADRWCRVKVEFLEDKKLRVFRVDYGDRLYVSANHMRRLDVDDVAAKWLVSICRLDGIKPCGGDPPKWSLSANEMMRSAVMCGMDLYLEKTTPVAKGNEVLIPCNLYLKRVTAGALTPETTDYISVADLLVSHGYAMATKVRDHIVEGLGKPRTLEKKQVIRTPSQPLPPTETMQAWPPAKPIHSRSFKATPSHIDDEGIITLHTEQHVSVVVTVRGAIGNLIKSNSRLLCELDWEIGEPCFAQYYLDNEWYRGVVIERTHTKDVLKVMFVDFGTVDNIPRQDLRKVTCFKDVTVQAWRCKLYNALPIDGEKWDESTMNDVHGMIVEKECVVTVHSPVAKSVEPYPISLRLPSGQDLVDFLVDSGLARFVTTPVEENKAVAVPDDCATSPYPSKMLPDVGAKILVKFCYMNRNKPKVVYLHPLCPENPDDPFTEELLDMAERYQEMSLTLENEEELQPLKNYRHGEPCCGKYSSDQKWHRAYIKNIKPQEKFLLEYVDFGNEEEVEKSDIRELPSSLIELPPLILECELDKVVPQEDEWTDELINCLAGHIMNEKKMFAVVQEITEDQVVKVDLMKGEEADMEFVYQPLIDKRLLALRKQV